MHFDYALMYYSVFKMFLHINFMLTTQLMPTITWAKKSPSKSTHIGSKVHIVATWGTINFFNINTPFEGPVVLRLKYPPMWAEHTNCYLLKECWNLIFYSSPCSHNMYL